MKPVAFPGMTGKLRAPHATGDGDLPFASITDPRCVVTCWQLDAAELAEVMATGRVYLIVHPSEVNDGPTVRIMVPPLDLRVACPLPPTAPAEPS